MALGTFVTTVAAVGFASDDRWAQHPFGLIIGGIEFINVQETQDVLAVFAQPFGETGIIRVGQLAFGIDQLIQASFQFRSLLAKLLFGQL